MRVSIEKDLKGVQTLIDKLQKIGVVKKVNAGWFMNRRYAPRVTYHKGKNGELIQHQSTAQPARVSMVAEVQDAGTYTRPRKPRPIFRPTVKKNEVKWDDFVAEGMKEALDSGNAFDLVFEKLGAMVAADIQLTIKAIQNPPLTKGTIDSRKRTLKETAGGGGVTSSFRKPLISTSTLIKSVRYEVEK
jgi:hypothetical protein